MSDKKDRVINSLEVIRMQLVDAICKIDIEIDYIEKNEHKNKRNRQPK